MSVFDNFDYRKGSVVLSDNSRYTLQSCLDRRLLLSPPTTIVRHLVDNSFSFGFCSPARPSCYKPCTVQGFNHMIWSSFLFVPRVFIDFKSCDAMIVRCRCRSRSIHSVNPSPALSDVRGDRFHTVCTAFSSTPRARIRNTSCHLAGMRPTAQLGTVPKG